MAADSTLDLWRDLPPLSSGQHRHFCAHQCGDYYVCSHPDGCPDPWICPVCEMNDRDDDMTALAAEPQEIPR